MPTRLDIRDPGFESAFARFLGTKREIEADVDAAVAGILDDVAARGDAAILEYTSRFDRIDLTAADFRIPSTEIDRAAASCTSAQREALALAAARITRFHERQRPADLDYIDDDGLRLGYRWTAIESVGLYVPGGLAAYPSSVLMNGIPARVAGVERLVMAVPTPDGVVSALVLAAARLIGIAEIYRIGGAQAIAALAYVAAAKRRVFGRVGIDMIAGPSEVLIVADGGVDPDWIACDLLAQAEHDSAAQSILITADTAFADRVARAVEVQLATLPRRAIAAASWNVHGCIILVETLDQAPSLIDRIAPEHLQLASDSSAALLARVRNAGSVFLGRLTPEALGDYVAGPNHVLPTGRSARFSSGLGVHDFLKRTTFLSSDEDGLGRIGWAAVTLAEAEGLDAHGRSVALRLNRRRES
jgi:histidinol dehydrogenase